MALVADPAHELGVRLDVPAEHEERRLRPAVAQRVEHGGVHSDEGPSSNVSASTRSLVPRPVTTRPKSGEFGVNEAHAQIRTSMQTRPKIDQPAQPASAVPTTSATAAPAPITSADAPTKRRSTARFLI